MNGLYTSYLGFFNRKDVDFVRWDSPDGLRYLHNVGNHDVAFIPFFVILGRGNDEVAPSKALLDAWKNGDINWTNYKHWYLEHIHGGFGHGVRWMKRIGELAQKELVVLVCYEKDVEHCHRKLLAENVAKWSGCEYKGELSEVER